jgi:hypothetical protein
MLDFCHVVSTVTLPPLRIARVDNNDASNHVSDLSYYIVVFVPLLRIARGAA